MTAEDRLRELLQREAETLHPTGDGLARVQQRVARRRKVRQWVWPTAGLVTAATAAALVLVLPDDPRRTEVLVPASPGPTTTSSPTTAPSATPSGPPLPGSHTGAALWPVTLGAEAAAWDGGDWVSDSAQVAQRFVSDYLDLDGVTAQQDCVSCAVVTLEAGGREVGQVQVVRYAGQGYGPVWAVAGVTSESLTVSAPAPDQPVTSPLTVTGQVPGADESVAVTLRTAPAGAVVVQAFAPAGGEAPWSTTLSWSGDADGAGALVAVTRSMRDGSVTRLHVQPVRVTATEPPRFAALVDGHVSLFDGVTGERVRQLTYPPQGKQDVEAAHAGPVTLWVRRGAGGCADELNRLYGQAASTLVPAGRVRLSSPRVSPSGDLQVWVEQSCTDPDSGAVVVTVNGTGPRRLPTPTGSVTRVLDVRDDGALLVLTNDREASGPGAIGLVRAGATTLNGLTPLQAEPGCYLAGGGAFAGQKPVVFQTCEDGIQLLRFSATGALEKKEGAVDEPTPRALSARGTDLLVERSDGTIARYAQGRFAVLVTNEGCASSTDLKGCVRAPDW